MRATGIITCGRLFPDRLFCRESNKALEMLSGMYASLGVNSPSSSSELGGKEITPSSPGRGDALAVCIRWVVSPGFLTWIDCPVASSGLLEGVRSFCPSGENGFVFAMVGASEFPAVDVRLVPRLDTVEEEGFENLTFFFFGAEDGITPSPDCFPGILI